MLHSNKTHLPTTAHFTVQETANDPQPPGRAIEFELQPRSTRQQDRPLEHEYQPLRRRINDTPTYYNVSDIFGKKEQMDGPYEVVERVRHKDLFSLVLFS